ncbi:hypothetical protein SBRY_11170 [Actinacidiphila bryophytorum]|uniref:Uncharacterized protein n=1 Tax=Actinacidiphila bryophytorum TaxID=1436133 RepID=A0A9W4E2T1_9ACTN|nr:hypothetical protein SBRY_11170 [Actinacidiphila bryophytorum]
MAAGTPVRSDLPLTPVERHRVPDPRADLSHPREVFSFPGPPAPEAETHEG